MELIINGQLVEMSKNNEIEYNMQIADIFDISTVNASYTNSFKIPKTPNNVRIMQFLGIAGDNSQIPYEKISASLKDFGFDVISNGWLSVKDTDDYYNVNIIDGIIDFFKAIENATLGIDFDLSNFEHEKTPEIIFSTFNTSDSYYKYLVADYNGKNTSVIGSATGINIDYLIPSFNVLRLLDLIFLTYGYTYNQSEISYLEGLYITYPLPPSQAGEPIQTHIATKGNFVTSDSVIVYGKKTPANQNFWSTSNAVTPNTFLNNWKFIIGENKSYKIEVITEGYAKIAFGVVVPFSVNIFKNGVLLLQKSTDPLAPVTLDIQFNGNINDVIEVIFTSNSSYNVEWHHNSTEVTLSTIGLGNIDLQNVFKDFKIKDFFKEILWRTGLTPVKDKNVNHISFVSLQQRLSRENSIDWTSKFLKRNKEGYIYNDYAQKNIFSLKHNNEDDLTGNGNLFVNNKNLTDEKILIDSKIYAPEYEAYRFFSSGSVVNFDTYKYRVWERETEENEEGNLTINYKALSNRFFFVRFKRAQVATWSFVSDINNDDYITLNSPNYAVSENTLFDEAVYNNYSEYSTIFQNFRVHELELLLSLPDALNVDFLKPYFFRQENAFYILNKLTYRNKKTSIGQFIKLKDLT